MRTMLRLRMDVNAANDAIDNGSMQTAFKELNNLVNPEASYFTTDNGKRTAYFFFDLTVASMIPKIAEPLFHILKAEIDFKPVMIMEDLAKGLAPAEEQDNVARQ